MMIRSLILAGILALSPALATSQTINDLLGILGGQRDETVQPATTVPGYGVSAFEADAGLREALTMGAELVATRLAQENGYFGDGEIRIPLPGRLRDVQSRLQPFGLSDPLDDLQLRMNRAAEASVPVARDLIVDAVSTITLEDAVGILSGGDTAATAYLRERTEASLMSAFRPHVAEALGQSGALTMVDSVSRRYGVGDLGTGLRESLVDHAVQYGLDGLFYYIAEEERAIRQDPVKRSTDLLRRVFGR